MQQLEQHCEKSCTEDPACLPEPGLVVPWEALPLLVLDECRPCIGVQHLAGPAIQIVSPCTLHPRTRQARPGS